MIESSANFAGLKGARKDLLHLVKNLPDWGT